MFSKFARSKAASTKHKAVSPRTVCALARCCIVVTDFCHFRQNVWLVVVVSLAYYRFAEMDRERKSSSLGRGGSQRRRVEGKDEKVQSACAAAQQRSLVSARSVCHWRAKQLPDDMERCIMEFLELHDLTMLDRASKWMSESVTKFLRPLRTLDFALPRLSAPSVFGRARVLVLRCRAVQVLDFSGSHHDSTPLAAGGVAGSKFLTRVVRDNAKTIRRALLPDLTLTTDTAKALSRCPRLQVLDIARCTVRTPNTVAALAVCKKLKVLDVDGLKTTTGAAGRNNAAFSRFVLDVVANNPALRSLSVSTNRVPDPKQQRLCVLSQQALAAVLQSGLFSCSVLLASLADFSLNY